MRQFKLTIGGMEYYTLDGITDEQLQLLTNKFGRMNLMSATNLRLERLCKSITSSIYDGVNPSNFDAVAIDKVEEFDGIFVVKGTTVIDGETIPIVIDATGVHYTLPEKEEVVEKAEEPEVVVEEAEPVVEEEEPTVEEVAKKVVEETAEEVAETTDEEAAEPVPVPPYKPPMAPIPDYDEDEKEQETEEIIMPLPEVVTEFPEPIMPEPVEDRTCPRGFVLGNRANLSNIVKPTAASFGHNTKKRNVGFAVNAPMPTPNTSENFRYQALNPVSVTGRPAHQSFQVTEPEPQPEPVVTKPVEPEPVKEPEQEESSFMSTWQKQSSAKPTDWVVAEPEPETVQEDTAETEFETALADNDYKAAKEAVRAKLSPEINKIIGDIPHALLGDITQFTVNRVDVEKLNKLKDIYCIDNNWHHVGSWFCIDVVKESGRYFFNNKLGVSILIPISILKQWKEVVA